MLAGRAIEAEPAGAARLVAGIGVATFLVAGASGVLVAFESTPQFRYADQVLHEGPQTIGAWSGSLGSDDEAVSAAQGAALRAVPGVSGLVDGWTAEVCNATNECTSAFVGTCTQLELMMVATGCSDDAAALIQPANADAHNRTTTLAGGQVARVTLGGFDDDDAVHADVTLGSVPIIEDVQATNDRWVYGRLDAVFVPTHLIVGASELPHGVDVVARGGTQVQAAVAKAAESVGMSVFIYPTDEDISQVMQVRAIVWSLSAVIVGIALITVGLGTIDRALERRRAVARQIAVGVPARVLRRGQLLQTLLPLGISILLATGCGALLMRGYLRYGDLDTSTSVGRLTVPLVASLLGAAVVSLATVPLIRTRLDPRLLRTE